MAGSGSGTGQDDTVSIALVARFMMPAQVAMSVGHMEMVIVLPASDSVIPLTIVLSISRLLVLRVVLHGIAREMILLICFLGVIFGRRAVLSRWKSTVDDAPTMFPSRGMCDAGEEWQ